MSGLKPFRQIPRDLVEWTRWMRGQEIPDGDNYALVDHTHTAADSDYTFTAPTSLTKDSSGTGTGSITDIQTLNDGNEYNLAENTGGAPNLRLRLNFTGIATIRGLVVKAYYVGTHDVNLELYNYSTAGYDIFTNMVDSNYYNYRTILIPDGSNYTDGTNAVMRFEHPATPGLGTHDLYVEYAALLG